MKLKTLTRPLKLLLIIFALLMAVAVSVTSVFAYYIKSSGTADLEPAQNTDVGYRFDAGSSSISNIKIKVTNPEYPVYVRATAVFCWKIASGEGKGDVYGVEIPVQGNINEQYPTCDYGVKYGEAWNKLEDGFYYYPNVVEMSGENGFVIDDAFIDQCQFYSRKDKQPENCVLSLEIIFQTVQAIGTTDDGELLSWQDAWGIDSLE